MGIPNIKGGDLLHVNIAGEAFYIKIITAHARNDKISTRDFVQVYGVIQDDLLGYHDHTYHYTKGDQIVLLYKPGDESRIIRHTSHMIHPRLNVKQKNTICMCMACHINRGRFRGSLFP